MNQGRPPLWKSPWLWIGLSCGVLVLGFGLLLLAPFFLISHKHVEDWELPRKEPALALAERAACNDPNVTVVSRDTKLRTVTLRNQKTGERFVLGMEDQNRLRIRTDAGEVVPDFAPPGYSGLLSLGSAAGPMPAWVPVPPGTKPHPVYAVNTGRTASGGTLLFPSGPAEAVDKFYRGELERKGFQLVPGDVLSASSPDFTSSLLVTPTEQKGRSGLLLTWSEATGNP